MTTRPNNVLQLHSQDSSWVVGHYHRQTAHDETNPLASFYDVSSGTTWNNNINQTGAGIELRWDATNSKTVFDLNSTNNAGETNSSRPEWITIVSGPSASAGSVNTSTNPGIISVDSTDIGKDLVFWGTNSGVTGVTARHTLVAGSLFVSSGSSSGGQSGSGRQTFSSGETGIINVEFTKLTDSSIELGFDWQGIAQYTVKVDRGGSVTQTSPSLSGSSGTVTGYTGSGAHSLTGLNDGDKVWVHQSTDENGKTPVYTHTKIDWSVGDVSGVKSVIAKTFAYDTGQSFDLMFYSVVTRYPQSSTTSSTVYITHDGTEQTASLPFEEGRTYKMLDFTENDYGEKYYTRSTQVSQNFW